MFISPSKITINFRHALDEQTDIIKTDIQDQSLSEKDKQTKKKQYIAGAAISAIVIGGILFANHRHSAKIKKAQVEKEQELKYKKEKEKAKKQIEEFRKKLEEETRLQKEALEYRLANFYDFGSELKEKVRKSTKESFERTRENTRKADEEFRQWFEDWKKQNSDLNEKIRQQQEEFRQWWENYKTEWQSKNQKFYKDCEDIFNNNKTKETANTSKIHFETPLKSKDIEDYTGFTKTETDTIKEAFSGEITTSYIDSNKHLLARYLNTTEDDVISLYTNHDKKIFKKLSLKWHPDVTKDETKNGRFQLINYLYNASKREKK